AAQILQVDPNSHFAHHELQLYFRRIGGHDREASFHLRRFRELAEADEELNSVKMQMCGRQYTDKPRDNPRLRYRPGIASLQLGQDADAVLWFTRALIEDPHYRPAHVALADHYEKTGRHDLAKKHRQAANE